MKKEINKILFKDLWKVDRYSYRLLHRAFEEEGMKVKKGDKVVLTEWGFQNGIGAFGIEGIEGIVTSNPRKFGYLNVRLKGRKSTRHYWAGFWRLKKSVMAK